MNHWHIEYMAESHRQDLLSEREQTRLVSLATQSRVYHPSLFARTMHNFAGWMILKGKELHERYEIPYDHSHQKTTSSFAR